MRYHNGPAGIAEIATVIKNKNLPLLVYSWQYFYFCAFHKNVIMSANHDTTHHPHNESLRTKTSFTASFWLVIILIGLFIAALNFIEVMGRSNEDSHNGHAAREAHATDGSGTTESANQGGMQESTTREAAGASAADSAGQEEAARH